VVGGVPRYLEEVQTHQDAETNLKRMCFSPEGFLFSEFEKIFKDIFESSDVEYRNIVEELKDGSLEYKELCQKLGVEATGGFSKKLDILESSGFIKKDYVYNELGKKSRLFKLRICDNYVRYYLKYVHPRKDQIAKHLLEDLYLEDLKGWDVIVGLQFENLVLNNLRELLKLLQISPSSLQSASPYFQRQTEKMRACQIDLLIQTQKSIYPCEIKFKKQLDLSVCEEMEAKLEKCKFSSKRSVRPVLIYHGELQRPERFKETFVHLVSFEAMLMGI
jgi:uncharacterized protein